jgi:2-polyprenyl-6-hydroxyphenyl methylase/3-demethylubiquinone-9 3-methyltransferase
MAEINNDIYNLYGDRWYTAYDDPIALLRAESLVKLPWITERLKKFDMIKESTSVLDVGCGAGFLSNALALTGMKVTGVDLSEDSLAVARKYDKSKKVEYISADAYHLPFADASFDVLTAMDFLEHVDRPQDIIQEFSRVLKPGGIFIFHTFNRNLLAYFVIIKAVEWLVKNTPKNMHILELFIKPKELETYCSRSHLFVSEWTGIRPVLTSVPLRSLFSGIVPKSMRFTLTPSLWLSYMGLAKKQDSMPVLLESK